MYLVIGKNNCPWCEAAKTQLENTKEDYAYVNLDEVDSSTKATLVQLLKEEVGMKTVPAIFSLVGGYNELMESYD